MTNVTKTYFPPLDEYILQVSRIWKNQWLTNRGALTIELENKLKNYLNIKQLILMNNSCIDMSNSIDVIDEYKWLPIKLVTDNIELIISTNIYKLKCSVLVDPIGILVDEKIQRV